jgi:vesicular inhibitory amino acid transporter
VRIILLTLPPLVTRYTARLLVKCLDADSSAFTYGDIASPAYSSLGRHFIEILFAAELLAANAALFILFADSFSALAPSLAPSICKIPVAICMIPLNLAPFKALSITSAIGIFCFVGILTTLVVAGLTKDEAPGSLLQLAQTSATPYAWRAAPATFGIFMAPWGAHSIVPAVYKDMRHPQNYDRALRYTYSICYGIALALAVLGYMMFGDTVLPEVTSSILSISEYPPALSAITLILVTTIPLTKVSLNNRPILDILDRKFGRHPQDAVLKISRSGSNKQLCWLARFAIAASCNLLELIFALAIPNFGSVVALMGSALCVTISVILPGCFYLRICHDKGITVSFFDECACWTLIVAGTICAVSGTLSAILNNIS